MIVYSISVLQYSSTSPRSATYITFARHARHTLPFAHLVAPEKKKKATAFAGTYVGK